MNDLDGLDWSAKPAAGQTQKTNANYSSSAFSALNPTPPISGRVSPLVSSKSPPPPKPSTPSNDSFANLVTFGNKSNKNVSLQEQQRQLAELKAQQAAAQKKSQTQWTVGDDAWNKLGSGRSTPVLQNQNGTSAVKPVEDEEDVFAAFNKPAAAGQPPVHTQSAQPLQSLQPEDDDDPFGLSEFQSRNKPSDPVAGSLLADADDDDILGDLGKPAQERPPPKQQPPRRRPSPESPASGHPQDKAVAELVDMGFPADKAKAALESTDTGMNVQAAVGWLLNQAHEEARQKARGREPAPEQREEISTGQPRQRLAQAQDPQRDRSSTPSGGDFGARSARPGGERSSTPSGSDFGTTFIKSAGAFWKQAQKQVQQAVSEFNSDSESGSTQPKWMRDAEPKQRTAPARPNEDLPRSRPSASKQKEVDVTDEAMMLETERPTPPPRQAPRSRARPEHVFDSSADTSRDHSPAMPSRLRESHSPQPAFTKQDPLAGMMRPRPQQPPTKQMLNKQAIEEQASQAYVSSARRRKPAAPQAVEGDLMEGTSSLIPSRPAQSAPPRPTQSAPPQVKPKPAAPIATRPAPPKRTIPSISAIALKASHTSRLEGNESFKRGDYAAAHEHYTASLRHVPSTHPLQIVLLTNRALTALKTGQPKVAMTDADTVLTLIGASKGEGETVDLQDSMTPPKQMRDYYGKSLMRKAEALENLERWSDAAVVWRQCVEDGHGGAAAIQSRARAERAAAPKPVVKKAPPRPVTAKPANVKPAAAVSALRASNAAAERLDDEKFALADSVSARISGWKNGKEGNLRALLTSLDTVLWEGSGWKKVSMADVVLTNKVKIIYMKGIGKCHPDKIPTDATTEQRMIAGAVFSTLNEAWDKFKAENGL